MPPKKPRAKALLLKRRAIIALMLLVVGWTVAAVVYVMTPATVDDEDVYDMTHSRMYVREMERIGGKAAVFASDINEWFSGLWEGKARGRTIALASVLVAGAFLFVTQPPRPPTNESGL